MKILSMRHIFPPVFALLCLFLSGCQSTTLISQIETVSGPYGDTEWIGGSDMTGFASLHNRIAQADSEYYLDEEDLLSPAGRSHEKAFLLPKSRRAVVEERRTFPGFVVVQLHKLAQMEGVDERVMKVNQFFFSHGADRVLVTGFRGNGTAIYSDRIKKPNKAGTSDAG